MEVSEQTKQKQMIVSVEKVGSGIIVALIVVLIIIAIYHLIQYIIETGDEKLLKASKTLTKAKIEQTKVEQKVKEAEIIQEKANQAKLIAETAGDKATHEKAKKILIRSINKIQKIVKEVKKAEKKVSKETKKAAKQYKEAIIKIAKDDFHTTPLEEKFMLYDDIGTGAAYNRKWSKYYLDHTQADTFTNGRRLRSRDRIQLTNVATGKLCGDDFEGIQCDKDIASGITSFMIIKSDKLPKYVYDFVGIQQDPYQKSDVIMAGDWVYLIGGRSGQKCYTYGPSEKASCKRLTQANANDVYSYEKKFKIYLANSPFATGVPIKNGDKIGVEVLEGSDYLTYGMSTSSGGVVRQNSCNGNYTQFKQMTCDRQYALGESTHFRLSIISPSFRKMTPAMIPVKKQNMCIIL